MRSQHSAQEPEWGEAEFHKALEMLKTRVGQNTAVFAVFGSAAQHAQHFEAALVEFLSEYNKVANKGITLQDLEAFDQKWRRKTLGTLLKEFSKYVTIGDHKISELLEVALTKRNFLMHHFFVEREAKLSSEQGRMELLSELTGIDIVLEQAATIIRAMRIAFARQAGGGDEASASNEKAIFTMEVNPPK